MIINFFFTFPFFNLHQIEWRNCWICEKYFYLRFKKVLTAVKLWILSTIGKNWGGKLLRLLFCFLRSESIVVLIFSVKNILMPQIDFIITCFQLFCIFSLFLDFYLSENSGLFSFHMALSSKIYLKSFLSNLNTPQT